MNAKRRKRKPLQSFLHGLKRYLTARNAGVVFYHDGLHGREVLLVKRALRRGRNLWGGAGGSESDVDGRELWQTAIREAREEFGDHTLVNEALAQYRPHGGSMEPTTWRVPRPYVHFRLFAVKLSERPAIGEWPSMRAKDSFEWSEARWFAEHELPVTKELLPGHWGLRRRMKRWI